MQWHPTLGAWPTAAGVRFRVWAPEAQAVDVVIERGGATEQYALAKSPDGTFASTVATARIGDRYRYRIDGRGPFPDPASRWQPDGVHGASQVVDPHAFVWTDGDWRGVSADALILYELHVGTFTPAGTFAAVVSRLPALVDLGVNALELMPVADFAGERNWGYDGVDLFAPARCYGTPDDLRRLVDAAHQHGLAVCLDVVYNHFGPDGAYVSTFSPYYFTDAHHTPWGRAVNLDGPHSGMVRQFFIQNALHWLHEYHIDGLRLDATHALVDDSPRHFLAELADSVRAAAPRPVFLIAEDHRNLRQLITPPREGGWGLDAVWADDFHHQLRCRLVRDREGYFADYCGSTEEIAATVRNGWFYAGQYSVYQGAPRGTDPSGIALPQFVICLQNHDQIGNRAFGERLHHEIAPAAYRAASVLLLCAPETPLLFMGQEWAATSPFLYFSDHHPELGRQITEGRRREFRRFSAFADPASQQRIPDPQARGTFETSRLAWDERDATRHAPVLRLYRALLAMRRAEPAFRGGDRRRVDVRALGPTALVMHTTSDSSTGLVAIVHLEGAARVDAPVRGDWEVLLSTEDAAFANDPRPITIEPTADGLRLGFGRPGAVVLRLRS